MYICICIYLCMYVCIYIFLNLKFQVNVGGESSPGLALINSGNSLGKDWPPHPVASPTWPPETPPPLSRRAGRSQSGRSLRPGQAALVAPERPSHYPFPPRPRPCPPRPRPQQKAPPTAGQAGQLGEIESRRSFPRSVFRQGQELSRHVRCGGG
jgi:hypothetical protein